MNPKKNQVHVVVTYTLTIINSCTCMVILTFYFQSISYFTDVVWSILCTLQTPQNN